jgi:hypothetical protein
VTQVLFLVCRDNLNSGQGGAMKESQIEDITMGFKVELEEPTPISVKIYERSEESEGTDTLRVYCEVRGENVHIPRRPRGPRREARRVPVEIGGSQRHARRPRKSSSRWRATDWALLSFVIALAFVKFGILDPRSQGGQQSLRHRIVATR